MGKIFQTLWDMLTPAAPEAPPAARARRPGEPGKSRNGRQELQGRRPARDHGGDPPPSRVPAAGHQVARAAPPRKVVPIAIPEPSLTMQGRYDAMVESKLREYGVRVRKWRTAMSGIAWQVEYRNGTVARLIEVPRPKGPMSAAVFLHEIGHHAIGFNVYKPRCLEEYHAWAFAIREMEAHGLNITVGVRKRMHNSLKYAVDKARRRGLQKLPAELVPYLTPWSGRGGDA